MQTNHPMTDTAASLIAREARELAQARATLAAPRDYFVMGAVFVVFSVAMLAMIHSHRELNIGKDFGVYMLSMILFGSLELDRQRRKIDALSKLLLAREQRPNT